MDTAGQVVFECSGFSRFSSTSSRWRDIVRYIWEPDILGKENVIHGIFRRASPRADHRPLFFSDDWGADCAFIVACVARIRFAGTDEILFYQGTPPEQINYFHQLTRNIGSVDALRYPGYHTLPLKLCATYIRKHCRAVRGTSYVLLTLTVFLCLYSGGSAQYVQKNRP